MYVAYVPCLHAICNSRPTYIFHSTWADWIMTLMFDSMCVCNIINIKNPPTSYIRIPLHTPFHAIPANCAHQPPLQMMVWTCISAIFYYELDKKRVCMHAILFSFGVHKAMVFWQYFIIVVAAVSLLRHPNPFTTYVRSRLLGDAFYQLDRTKLTLGSHSESSWRWSSRHCGCSPSCLYPSIHPHSRLLYNETRTCLWGFLHSRKGSILAWLVWL